MASERLTAAESPYPGESSTMADENDLEPEKIEKENRTVFEKLRDLVNGLKHVEEYERTIPPKPDESSQ